MKLKRLISGTLAIVLTSSTLSLSTYADINKKPLEIGFETGLERQDSDDYDFLDTPYSLDSGYYMGLGIYTYAETFRFNIGDPTTERVVKNTNNEIIKGVNSLCRWSYLYGDKYAYITKDSNGITLLDSCSAWGPTGIFYDEDEDESGIKEYAQLHDAKITGSGTYTVGIQGYNFKSDVASITKGNGIRWLFISSNIKYSEENGVTIKNPVLKLYNSKEAYESQTPYKTIEAGYWITSPNENQTGNEEYKDYTKFTFVSNGLRSGYRVPELYKEISFDNKYQDNNGDLDVFGLSGYTGSVSNKYETGYEGCQYLPEYAIEITFDVEMPQDKPKPPQKTPINTVKTTAKPTTAPTKTTKPVVKPKKATIKKLTPKKKALKVTWKKVGGAKGYEIKLATNKKFTKNKKTVKVKKGSATSQTIKKLKSGKKYFVKIRTYKKVTIDGYTVIANGPWSNVKSKKVK